MGVYGVGGTGVVKDLKITEYKNWEVKFQIQSKFFGIPFLDSIPLCYLPEINTCFGVYACTHTLGQDNVFLCNLSVY